MTSVRDLTRQMDSERRDLGRNLSELKQRAESAVDWREQVRQHPVLATAAALGAGMLLAQLGQRRPRAAAPAPATAPGGEAAPREPGMLDAVGDTLRTTAATAMAGMLGEILPGFRAEHERRRA